MTKDLQQQYLESEKDCRLFFNVFYEICKKFDVQYERANEKDKKFVDEMTIFTFRMRKAKRDGMNIDKVERPFELAF